MTQLYIGQRVKKVRGRYCIGTEGVVDTLSSMFRRHDITLVIATGAEGGGERFDPGDVVCAQRSQWEPTLAPGLESPAEIAALFEPSPEVASA